jgi:hypothetical protein
VSHRRWESRSQVIYCHPLDWVCMYFYSECEGCFVFGWVTNGCGRGEGWIKWAWRDEGLHAAQIPVQFIGVCVGAWVVQMRSLEHLGDILPAKHDIHTEPLSGRRHYVALLAMKWMRHSMSRFLLSFSHESLRAIGFNALMHERDKKNRPGRSLDRVVYRCYAGPSQCSFCGMLVKVKLSP